MTTIEEIHNEWFTASEKLCESHSEENAKRVRDKVDRLYNLGFINTKDTEAKMELEQIGKTKELIDQYAISHPNNKVISEWDVRRLCQKYGLIYGELSRFKGFVPEKNLKEIESFYHKDLNTWVVSNWFGEVKEFYTEQAASEYIKNISTMRTTTSSKFGLNPDFNRWTKSKKAQLIIAAPKDDMVILNNDTIVNNQIVESKVYPDPVVLCPITPNKDFFLIVTAWGDEASDELVVNHKMN